MDMFYEKIVKRRKSFLDIAYSSLIITLALILSYLAFLFLTGLSPIVVLGIGYLAWFLATKRNFEYEYVVTNGDLDIDVIINQRKRKRVFSANCKDFEIIARVKSDQYTGQIQAIKTVEDYSSKNPEADVWFINLKHNGIDKVILFEPEDRMVECFRTFIPRKVFRS